MVNDKISAFYKLKSHKIMCTYNTYANSEKNIDQSLNGPIELFGKLFEPQT